MTLTRSQFLVLVNAWLLGFSMWITLLNISPIISLVKDSLDLNFTQSGFIFSLPLITLALLALFGGLVADRIGPRRAAGIGTIIFSLGGLLRALSVDIFTLTLFTTIVGIGLAFCYPSLPKIIGLWFPSYLYGTASGVYGTGIMIGSTVALAVTVPLVYPILGTWRGVFLVWGLLSMAISAVWWASMRKNPPGTAVFGSPKTERTSKVILGVLRARALWIIAGLLFFDNILFYVEVTWLVPFLMRLGFAIKEAAILESLVAVAGVPTIIVIPFISDKVRTRKPFLLISGVISAAAASALGFTPSSSIWLIPIILGITVTAIFVTSLILPVDLFPGEVVGTASGLVISLGYVGGLIGPLIAGYLADLTGSFSFLPGFLALFSLMVVSLSIVPLTYFDTVRREHSKRSLSI